ncbi:acyltransferase family protein [Kitasatospora kifunensis]|uniref:Peptidoglycan/LPS O-acetylase OafA/YrhL n=1 Tax=Kitasatospora kifunensis TaxID=58351 RepID=A0A7W7R5V6_KITKI|nr:acyltransferase [Kitasatospora kifunensis]MBB4925865.1 peptidoglycan/LPS O-acetylase OafA/YrhL [Kitasatospora kifunensis]
MLRTAKETRALRKGDAKGAAARLGWLDGLRGIAALLVAAHHFGLLNWWSWGKSFGEHFDLGIYAVMLFFLVSGYIVPASLERRGDVRGFWVGRIFRIYPLVIIVITLALVLLPKGYSAVPTEVTDRPFWAYLANLTLLHEMTNIASALGPMWTLCYEMVFYFFVSALFVKGLHRQSAPISLFFAGAALLLGAWVKPAMLTPHVAWIYPETTHNIILATVVVMVTGLVLILLGRPEVIRIGAMVLGALGTVLLFFNARACFYESMMILATMFAGTVIFRAEKRQIDRTLAVITCAFVLLAGFLVGYMYNRGEALQRDWTSTWQGFALPYVAAWATFGLGMLLRERRWPRVMTWLGSISYSVYVVHVPILWATWWFKDKVVHFPSTGFQRWSLPLVFFAAVLVASQLTYKLIEMPGQKLGKKVAKALERRAAEREQPSS